MRRVWILLCLLFPAMTLSAQETPVQFTCPEDNQTYTTQFTVTTPPLDENLLDLTVTALGVGNYDPLVGIETPNDEVYCNIDDPLTESYTASLDSGEVPPAVTGASDIVFDFGRNAVYVADQEGNTGGAVIIFEGIMDTAAHTYTVTITEAMAESDSLQAYLVALTGDYLPDLTLTDAEGTVTEATESDATLTTPLDESSRAVAVPLPTVAGDVDLTVNPNEFGFYALVLDVQSGTVQVGDGAASVETTANGAITLSCDNTPIFENGMQIAFPDDDTYTTTVLSDGADTIVAVLDDTNTGTCFDDVSAADFYAVDVPSIQTTRDSIHTQVAVRPDDASVVFGSIEGAAGNYVTVIEGGIIDSATPEDTYTVTVTPQMVSAFDFLTVYIFTLETEFDPLLTWQASEDESIVCSAPEVQGLCDQEDVPTFADSLLQVGPNETIQSVNYNPALSIPVDEEMQGMPITLTVSGVDDTAGEYIMVLHFVTD